MTPAQETAAYPRRIAAIDAARGVALVAMAIYHFTWDLEFFGYAPPGTAAEGGWRIFARMIAGSFLFLVGFSLVLAHGKSIRWRSFAIRLAQVGVAALAITIATRFATPDRYIFFGHPPLHRGFERCRPLVSSHAGGSQRFGRHRYYSFFSQPGHTVL